MLITILVTQLVTHRRLGPSQRRADGRLLILAAVDVSLRLGLGGGGFAFTTVQDVLWATGLAMIADAARPSRTSVTGVGAGIGSAVAVVAALCALVMLGTAPAWPRPG